MFAHVPTSDDVHGGVAGVLRLGPLLPLILGAAVATVVRMRPAVSTRRAVCVVASAAAGAIHLALVPDHYAKSPAVGAFFAAAGLTQLVVAVGVAGAPNRSWWPRLFTVVAVAVTVAYIVTRAVALPVFGRREPLDALGVVTTVLAVLAAWCWWPADRMVRWLADGRFAPSVVIVGVLLAPGLFGTNQTFVDTAVVAAVGCAVATCGGVERRRLRWVIADAAVVALVVRGPAVGFVIVGAALGLAHAAKADRALRWLPAASAALVVTLSIPVLDLRLDLVHVGHPGETTGAVALFVFAGLFSATAVAHGRLAALVAVYGLLAAVEVSRYWFGATGAGSVEVFVTSLTMFVLVAPVLLDDAGADGVGNVVVTGAATGLSVGVLRVAGVAYPIPWGVLVGGAVGAVLIRVGARRRPARRGRTERASATRPPGT